MKKVTLFSEFKKEINNTHGEVFKIGDVIKKVNHLESSTAWKRSNNNPNCLSYFFTQRMKDAKILTKVKHGHYKLNTYLPDWLSSSAIEFIGGRTFYQNKNSSLFKGYTREELRDKLFNSKQDYNKYIGWGVWWIDYEKGIKVLKKINKILFRGDGNINEKTIILVFTDKTTFPIDETLEWDFFKDGFEVCIAGTYQVQVIPPDILIDVLDKYELGLTYFLNGKIFEEIKPDIKPEKQSKTISEEEYTRLLEIEKKYNSILQIVNPTK